MDSTTDIEICIDIERSARTICIDIDTEICIETEICIDIEICIEPERRAREICIDIDIEICIEMRAGKTSIDIYICIDIER